MDKNQEILTQARWWAKRMDTNFVTIKRLEEIIKSVDQQDQKQDAQDNGLKQNSEAL